MAARLYRSRAISFGRRHLDPGHGLDHEVEERARAARSGRTLPTACVHRLASTRASEAPTISEQQNGLEAEHSPVAWTRHSPQAITPKMISGAMHLGEVRALAVDLNDRRCTPITIEDARRQPEITAPTVTTPGARPRSRGSSASRAASFFALGPGGRCASSALRRAPAGGAPARSLRLCRSARFRSRSAISRCPSRRGESRKARAAASGSAASRIARTTTIALRAGRDDLGDVGGVDAADREPGHGRACSAA